MSMMGNLTRWGLFLSGLGILISNFVFAAGKAPPTCGEPGLSTPTPIRAVVTSNVGTKPFRLPNGAQVNLNADLNTILNTMVTEAGAFAVSDFFVPSNCGRYLELRAAVTTLELETTSVRVKFGYTPAGDIGTVTNVTGEVGVKLGTASMDFQIFECVPGSPCRSVIASFANQGVLGADVGFKVDFSSVTTSGSLMHQSDLGKKLRSIMQEGLKNLATHPRVHQLHWQAKVVGYSPSSGIVEFDAGQNSGIRNNQTFEIYGTASGGNACPVLRAVAYVHTIDAGTATSRALVDTVLNDNPGILPGDVVMVRAIQP